MIASRHETAEVLPERIGLIAGGGVFPFEVARAARAHGLGVVCAGIRLEVFPELAAEVDVFRKVGLCSLGKFFRVFRRHGVKDIVWAGFIRKERIFSVWGLLNHLPDRRGLRFIMAQRKRNRQSQDILSSLADEFESEGFILAESARFCPELVAEEGLLSRRKPSARQLEDIAFGWRIAKRMADLDVGQSVAVYKKATVAVEGLEGTDRNIRRAGELCGGGFTLVKLAMDRHDMRFDVPAVGPGTIRSLAAAKGAVLALEAGKTLILERDEFLELADRAGIAVVALTGPPS